MGLAVVHGIVKGCGGAITVSSEVKRGTTFEIYFPEVTAGVIEQYETGQDIQGGEESIMLVDDDVELLEITQRLLVSLGYNAYAFSNPLKALAEFKIEPDAHDLVITDMTMPKITGAELATEIYSARPDIPIIMCTGFSEIMNEQQAKAIGFRAYLMKPILKSQMAQTIRRVLENGRHPGC